MVIFEPFRAADIVRPETMETEAAGQRSPRKERMNMMTTINPTR
jgi:hypothetical protein